MTQMERGGGECKGIRPLFLSLFFCSSTINYPFCLLFSLLWYFTFFLICERAWCRKLQLWKFSVFNQWQQSIHKHSLPAASGISHKGLCIPARVTQLPGLQATHRKITSTFLDTDTHVEHVCSCRQEKHYTFLDLYLCVCVLELLPTGKWWETV